VVVTVTVADWLVLPPLPEHVSVKAVVAVRLGIDSLPLIALEPVQPPEAVQLVALLELQVTVVLPPLATDVGFTVIVTAGACTLTLTSTVFVVVPPAPAQESVYDFAECSAPVDSTPVSALVPFHAPEAVQFVASVVSHESAAAVPLVTLAGLALNVIDGAALPPEPDPDPPTPPIPPQADTARAHKRTAISERGVIADGIRDGSRGFGGWLTATPGEAQRSGLLRQRRARYRRPVCVSIC
jgi:hypothetical protein